MTNSQTTTTMDDSYDEGISTLTQAIVSAFTPTRYRPFLFLEANAQTILSNFFPTPRVPDTRRYTLRSADNETDLYIDVCEPVRAEPSGSQSTMSVSEVEEPPIALIVPGMESNAGAVITRRALNVLSRNGFRTHALNYRSCAGAPEPPPRTARLYHAGFTDDVLTVLRHLRLIAPSAELVIVGFSLGANIVMNLLGRFPRELKQLDLAGAAAVAVPFDPAACVRTLDGGWKGALYSARLVADLRRKLLGMPGIDADAIEKADRVGKVDEAVIAPAFGYKDRFAYYDDVDARRWIPHVRIPTLVLNSRDDPFYSHHRLKRRHLACGTHAVRIEWSDAGGHCAFLDDETIRSDRDGGFSQREVSRWFLHVLHAREKVRQ